MGKEKDNVIKRKSRDFAIDIINLYKWLCEIQHEYICPSSYYVLELDFSLRCIAIFRISYSQFIIKRK